MNLIFFYLFILGGGGGLNPQLDSLNKAVEEDTPATACSGSLGSICMLRTHTLGPNCKMETVCFFLMNWAMCRNNKISLCSGDSQMTIIQQRSHFRQRTSSYIMHLNHCIFPPCWATMHISLSQWNIKHSYDLIFSSRGDCGLYSFSTSLASPQGPNFRVFTSFCLCLFTGKLLDWPKTE